MPALQVTAYIHAPMENAGNVNLGILYAVNDDVLTGGEHAVRAGDFFPDRADFWIVPYRQQGLMNHRTVGQHLRLAPGFPGVLEDVGEIVFGPWGEDQAPLRG